MKKIFSSPFRIILTWIVFSIVSTFLISIVMSIDTPDGAQVLITVIAKMVPIIIYVTLALAIVTMPFYKTWKKKVVGEWNYYCLLFVLNRV